LGADWIEAWTLRLAPAANIRWEPTVGHTAALGAASWQSGRIEFAGGRSLVGCTEDAWSYTVSGRAVIPKYLDGREHWDARSAGLLREIRLVVTAVDSAARIGSQLDDLLTGVLSAPLHHL
jgi:hypothetical protein